MLDYRYCPKCGNELENRIIGDLGSVPFCWNCQQPFLKTFPTSVIVSVINERHEVILMNQPYTSAMRPGLIAGKIAYGESAEMTVIKEVAEEIGHRLEKVEFVESYFNEKQKMLMLGFVANVHTQELKNMNHSTDAKWCSFDAALSLVSEGSVAQKHLETTWNIIKRQQQDPSDRMFETG